MPRDALYACKPATRRHRQGGARREAARIPRERGGSWLAPWRALQRHHGRDAHRPRARSDGKLGDSLTVSPRAGLASNERSVVRDTTRRRLGSAIRSDCFHAIAGCCRSCTHHPPHDTEFKTSRCVKYYSREFVIHANRIEHGPRRRAHSPSHSDTVTPHRGDLTIIPHHHTW